jgi:hypothetical protein
MRSLVEHGRRARSTGVLGRPDDARSAERPGLDRSVADVRTRATVTVAAPATQPTVQVSSPTDRSERDAERVADRVVRMSNPESVSTRRGSSSGGERVQRMCARCRRRLRRREPLRCPDCERSLARAGGDATAVAADAVERAVAVAVGKGRPLSADTRWFFEPRFGRDFGDVRVHTGPDADTAARGIGARAFTLGSDIVMRSGEYRPETDRGTRLLAHELTHVVQQTGGSTSTGDVRVDRHPGRRLMRTLSVANPSNPVSKGSPRTNVEVARDYLSQLCSKDVSVDNKGNVSTGKGFCSYKLTSSFPFFELPAARTKTPIGCTCVCDIVHSSNDWTIEIDDKSWPHTSWSDKAAAEGKKPGGSGGVVTAPSPNSPTEWGAATTSGKPLAIDPWLVLGHELCGHAWLGDQGRAGEDRAQPRGEGGHQRTVERENLLRREHGIPERGSFRDPYCGESYRRSAAGAAIQWSSFLKKCKAWRKQYNKKHGTSYGIGDKIPKKPP